MENERVSNITDTVQLFKIFSDLTRLKIIDLLLEGEFCVQDISDSLLTSNQLFLIN